ncbi:RNA-guided endonuclease InsQ/TnpB family protein [Nocardia otitidiscaviarum]|uniref:RNA-guided endonuclease InsQ/TnpB family protein n=1 Tax=Nocardia otitidiscaviarum TaxID=1823 RepID=UPI0034DD18A6
MRLSDADIQKIVTTDAKRTPERAWLADVPAVVLVQAVNDAHRAYRSWFDSMAKRGKRGRVGKPRFKTRRSRRQSIRFTRCGFRVTTRGVRLIKVGEVRLEWSRALPSTPSSMTLIREADGSYYVSFVVEIDETPLPECATVAGIDLGLTNLVTVVRSDGERQKIASPGHLRTAQRRIAKAQKALCRKQKGSRNREKARVRVARLHRKVRDTRLDHHHKLALRLIRENQAIAVEDLPIAALGRTRLAKSIHDAGWALLLRLLREKAARYGRSVVRVDRWTPTTRQCSMCRHNDGAKGTAAQVGDS